MANAYTKIQIHIVFAVKYRRALIHSSWEEKLHRYITGIIQQRGHRMLAINGMSDHIHIYIGFKPVEDLSKLVMEIKKASNAYIVENKLSPYKFAWQEGYGAFSYSESQSETVINYILRQKEHHSGKSFKKEYIEMLDNFKVEYDLKYILQEPE
jgi:REP element-mobilizing transposase RayT